MPSETDKELRTERKAMFKEQRSAYLRTFFPGILTLLIIYVFLTIFRISGIFRGGIVDRNGICGPARKFVQQDPDHYHHIGADIKP